MQRKISMIRPSATSATPIREPDRSGFVAPPVLVRGAAAPSKAEETKVYACARVRPFNSRETDAGKGDKTTVPVIRMKSNQVEIRDLERNTAQPFDLDDAFWSMGTSDDDGRPSVTQADVYERIGKPILEHAYRGFNVCLFAYGQTGSGKTHTMMGEGTTHLAKGENLLPSDGLIPRVCSAIFEEKLKRDTPDKTWEVTANFVEIYNERVKDLVPAQKIAPNTEEWLDVRHQKDGSFSVQPTTVPVSDLKTIMALIALGRRSLHVAETKMSDRSSRSHSIFQIVLTEHIVVHSDKGAVPSIGTISKVNLVDLAGSERVSDSKVTGQQFTEATKINLSLSCLRRVIDALAAKGATSIQPPYRDSVLTKLLKDSLGGNSKTMMIATVSPSLLNYEESLATLRYASRARLIVNTVYVNEDPKVRMIQKLEEEVARLRVQRTLQENGRDPQYYLDLEARFNLTKQELDSKTSDLRQADLERQARVKAEEILTATEGDKRRLMKEAAELHQSLETSKKDKDEQENEMKRLRDSMESQASLMLMKTNALQEKQGQVESLQSELTTKQKTLQKTMQELERCSIALAKTFQTGKEADELRTEKKQIEKECAELQRDLEARERVIADMTDLKNELERNTLENAKQMILAKNVIRHRVEAAEIAHMVYEEACGRHVVYEELAELRVAAAEAKVETREKELGAAIAKGSSLEAALFNANAKSVSLEGQLAMVFRDLVP